LLLFVLFLFVIENAAKSEENEYKLNALLFVNNSTLVSAIPGKGAITGITGLGTDLFVVRAISAHVYVHNTNNFNLTRNISVATSSYLLAIVASPRYNCLYISDFGPKVVHRYVLSNNVVTNWYDGGDYYGLSLTSTYNILVTVWDTQQIKEYSPDGLFIREINLHGSIGHPYHSVQLPGNRFVVSHGFSGSLHRVCIVDTSGSILTCYGAARGSNVGQLNSPRNLAVDGHGNILVADQTNNRVVLLSPSLTHLGYIEIPGRQMSRPFALHLDKLTRRLYIGEDHDNGLVFVLTVSDQR